MHASKEKGSQNRPKDADCCIAYRYVDKEAAVIDRTLFLFAAEIFNHVKSNMAMQTFNMENVQHIQWITNLTDWIDYELKHTGAFIFVEDHI